MAQGVCGTPGKDGPGGTLSGIVNTYYPGTTSASAGATSLTLGSATGAATTITPGDLLLVIQMQDAAINSSNTSAYGAGTTTGSGSTDLNNSGRYEYVTATNSIGAGGGTLTLRGTGAGNGLINAYTNGAVTGTQGQRRFQVVRVPQYSSATLSSGLTSAYWNGTTGGILAIDVAGRLTLGGAVSVNGRGFRGGAGLGRNGAAGGTNTDYRSLSTNAFHGMKGEGVAGTPRWVLDPQTNINTDLGTEGYPNGDAGQGAPGNAGGGGTDGEPATNQENSGGGGGGNGGAGGKGGFTWRSSLDIGGRGGSAFTAFGVGRVILGGGGGAGTRNNSADPENAGGAGGGIVLIRADSVAGSGTITANGLIGLSPANDGGGGGGAGGSVVLLVNAGSLSGLSVQARGGNGGDAWLTEVGASAAHGPGGGGGGGVVITSSAATIDVAFGNRGSTTTGLLQFGASNGGSGQSASAALASSPGIRAGALCVASLTVTKTTSTVTVTNTPSGTTATYTIVVANAANRDTARSVALIDTLPAGFTYQSSSAPVLAGGASRPSTANPAGGATAPLWSSFSIPAGGSVSQTFVAAVASSVANGTRNNPAWAVYLDPKRITAAGTTSARYDTTAAGEDITVQSADLAVTKAHTGNFTVGTSGVYTITPRNSGAAASSGTITVVDTLPTGLTYSSGTGSGWACSAIGQVVTCTSSTAIAASTAGDAITLTVDVAAGAVPSVTNRAWVSGGNEPTGAEGNNSSGDPTTVGAASADVVTTKSGPAAVTAGANATYTLTATNNGPSAATAVALSDTLPAGATFVSATAGGTLSGSVVTWPAVASLASGGSSSVQVTVTYAAGGSYTDIAASTATTSDPTPANNNGSAAGARVSTTVGASADVVTSKTGPAAVTAGANATYTLTATNNGPSAATVVVLSDTLPAGATFVSATAGGTLSGSVVTWPAVASLASGGSSSVQVTVTYAAGGSYTDITASASSTVDPTPANNNGSAAGARVTTVVSASADVVTTKTGPAAVTAGANATYTLAATNNGPSAATVVVLSDTLPAGATLVSATAGGTLSGSVVTWPAVASLASGASSSVQVTVSYAAGGSYTDIAASTSTTPDPTPANNNGSAAGARVATVVSASADVVTTKTGPASVTAGANATYTLTATNNGPSAATVVVLSDTLPAGATFVSATAGGTLSGSVVSWPAVASLASGASSSVQVTVTYAAGGSYTDIAASSSTTPDPTPANNNGSPSAAQVTTVVSASADVVTTKSGPATATAGQNVVYTVTALNNGPSAAAGVVVSDTLPAGFAFVSASGGGIHTGGVVTWPSIASLANGASASFTVIATSPAAGSFTNIAANTASTSDPAPGNNNGQAAVARVTTVVAASADVTAEKTGPATASVGQDIVYAVTVSNSGPSPATNVVVSDTLPAGVTFVSATGGGMQAGGVVTWPSIALLANGSSSVYSVTVQATAAGTLLNRVASSAATGDPDPANNNGSASTARVSTVVSPSADVAAIKTGPAVATAGQDITYTVTATNNGPSAATNVVVTDTMPAGLTFVSASDGGTLSSGVISWPAIVSLANGTSRAYTVVVRATDAGIYTNLAASTAGTADPTGSNNNGSSPTARVTTVITGSADLVTSKTGPTGAIAGQDVTYTITTRNDGPSASLGVVVTDTIAAAGTFVGASNGGTLTGDVVTWPAVASLASGASVSLSVTVRFAAAGGYLDIAASTSSTSDPAPDNNDGSLPTARVTTVIGTRADVVTTKTGPAAIPTGQDATYTISTTNNGPNAAANVVVIDSLPAGATFVSASNGGTASGQVVTWPAVPSLANGGAVNYSVVVRYGTPGNVLNIAASTSTTPDPVPTNNDGSPPDGRVNTAVGPNADVVTTKSGPVTGNAGEDLTYTITIRNNGPTAATAVVASDTLPSGFIFVSASGGGTLFGNDVTWPAIASLASGASQTFTVVARASAAGTFVNRAASVATSPDPNLGNNDGSAPASVVTTVISISSDLVVTKAGPAAAIIGQDIVYPLTVVNNGPSAAAGVVVTDTLPPGLTFVGADAGGTLSGSVVTWPTIASLASGVPMVFTVTVRAAASGTYTDVAAGTSATPDPNPANNNGSGPAARVTTVVSSDADLVMSKSGPATVLAGQNATYTLTVTNNGPAPAAAVTVTDTLPAGVSLVSATAGGTPSGNVVTWPAIASLPAGGNASYSVTISLPVAAGYTNVAAAVSTSPDPAPANNRATAATTATAPSEIADVVTVKSGPTTAAGGTDIAFTIQTINSGPNAATNVVITDTLPAGATFVSATGGPTLAGTVLTWPAVAALTNGAGVSFVVTVRLSGPGSYTNIAASRSTTPDPNLNNNNGSASNSRTITTVAPAADLVTTKTGPATVASGGRTTYIIVTRNDGPDAAVNVAILDSLPSDAEFVSASNGGTFVNGVVTWPVIPSLPNGDSVTYTVTAVIRGAGSVTNVSRSGSGTPDPIPGNNRGTVTTALARSADVMTTKTGPDRVDAGGQITYQVKAKNRGPDAAASVMVVDSLPVGVTFVSASAGGTVSGRVVSWPTIANLAIEDSVVYTLVVTAPTTAGLLTNVVASTAATEDTLPENNNGSSPAGRVTTDVAPIDLAIAKIHDGDLIPGTIGVYRLTVTNVGPAPTTGPITVVDTLPAGLTLQSASGPGWDCSNAGAAVTCRFTTVPFTSGATTTITLKALVAKSAPAVIVNRVSVATPGDDSRGNNNAAINQAVVSTITPLAIEKRASRTDVEIADAVDYTVTIRNLTGSELPGVTVTDILPKGFAYQRQTTRVDLIPIGDPTGAPGPTLLFTLGSLAPHATVVLTYRLKVGAGATLGDGTNRAQARSTAGAESSVAVAIVRVARGVFSDRGIIIGRVFLNCDCDSSRVWGDSVPRDSGIMPARDSAGIPGARVFLEDGTSTVTDSEGKYNFYGIISGLHVVRVDLTTLPAGARLVVLDSRNAGEPNSRFVDLKNGELHKADFAVQHADTLRGTVDLRRARGEVYGAILDSLAGTGGGVARGSEGDRPVVAVDAASDTARTPAYRPLVAESSANAIDEANRLPVTRLPGSTVSLTTVPNGSVELTPARRALPADGNTAMSVQVRVLDQDRKLIRADQPVTLEASLGRWLASDLDPVEPGVQTVLKNSEGTFTLVASSEAGVGEIRVTNGLRVGTAQLAFLPSVRSMFVNGVLEARIDLRSLLRDGLLQVTGADRFERELKDLRIHSDDGKFSAAGRGALYLQGKVKGSTLLTLAFDSERDPERRMFRDIQPDEFYPVYGDASIKEFGAQSFDRLYVRVDNQRSYALYGDYSTPSAGNGALAARELGAYQRSLTGALAHAEGTRGQFNVFASRDRLSQVVEEISGQGISGPYRLRRADGRLNSEAVDLLTRDRNQPSRIITSVPMSRFTDYTLEPFTGRLLFSAPVPSVDGELNPVSIRVRYEVEQGGDNFWVYGADGQLRLGDRAEFGAGIVRDEQPLSSRQLYSANAAVSLAAGTVLQVEVARTDGDSAGFRGDAMRFELRHGSARLQATMFGATSDAGFSNQSSTFQPGRAELGFRGSAAVGERTRLIGEALRSEDRVTGGRRDGFLASVERQFGKFLRAEVGYRHAEESGGAASAGTAAPPDASPNATNALRTRVTLQVPGQPRASIFGEFEQDLKVSDQRRGAIGGQYVLFDRLRLYGRHEFLSSFAGPFALNGAQRQATTVIGLDAGYTRDGQFFGEYRGRDGFSGRETEAAIGLRNRWHLAKGLTVNTGFERVDVLKGAGQGEATALSAGVEYTTNPLWRGTARFEYRFAPSGDNLLATLGYARKLNSDWTVLGRSLYHTAGDGGKRVRNQIGFAWRETGRDRWNGLARWENRFERLGPSGVQATRESGNILSAHLNYQPTSSLWLSGRAAGKWATTSGAGLETSSSAKLISMRVLYDFLPRWDAGLIGSMMWSDGRQYGLGVEAGRTLIKNMRAAVGYNVFGFRDAHLTSDDAQTDRGLYLHLGFKFDELLFRK